MQTTAKYGRLFLSLCILSTADSEDFLTKGQNVGSKGRLQVSCDKHNKVKSYHLHVVAKEVIF